MAVLIGLTVTLYPLWQPGYPWGSDTWGHLQRAAYMGDTLRAHGLRDGLSQSMWMPDWYMGDPTDVYYPPLTTWALGLTTAAVGDVFLAYRLMVTVLFLILALSVYAVGLWWRGDRWMAAAGAVLAITAPFTLHTVFAEGNLPRGLAILTLPWIVWHTEHLLTGRHTARSFVLLAGLWGLAIVAHVMQAVMFAYIVAAYVVFRLLANVYIPLRRALLSLIPIPLGAGMAAAYLLPVYSHAELKNVPYLPAVKVAMFSISWNAIWPDRSNLEAISIGIALIAAAFLIMLRTNAPRHEALFVAGIASVILAFGPPSGVFRLLPLHDQLLPERFLNVSAVIFPMIVASTERRAWPRHWLVILLAVVLLVDARPALRTVHLRDVPPDENAIAAALADQPLPGRVATLTLPNPRASQIFLTSEEGGHANVSGWALENTPHHPAIRRLLLAAQQAPAYVARMLNLWNADYAIVRMNNATQRAALQAELGFEPVAQADTLALWRRIVPSAFVQQLPQDRMLIIGDNATAWLFAFPYASEGSAADPAAYDADYLAHFSVIGLSRVPDDAAIESALGEWVSAGNTLVVDLSGMGRTFDQGYTLFGVHAMSFALNNSYPITWPDALQATMPHTLDFTTPDGPWIGATYLGLDETLASLSHNGTTYPLLGRKRVGDGQVVFVGFNLIYKLQQEEDFAALASLTDYLLDGTNVNRDLALPPFDVDMLTHTASAIRFRYTCDTPADVVLSMTGFPRWQVTLDGARLALRDHEHLALLSLPAGTHTVQMRYEPFSTWPPRVGWLASVLMTGVVLLGGRWLHRHPLLATDDRLKNFSDRIPSLKPGFDTSYTSCPSCGFRLATSGPPNENSYPFQSIDCPICGFSLGSSPFASHYFANPATKETQARRWMREQGLTELDLVTHFDLSINTLFETVEGEPESLPDTTDTPANRLAWLAAQRSLTIADTATGSTGYTACHACGFRLAFKSETAHAPHDLGEEHCPICGTSPERARLLGPLYLPQNTRSVLVRAWLRRSNLDELDVTVRYQLTLDDLFESTETEKS